MSKRYTAAVVHVPFAAHAVGCRQDGRLPGTVAQAQVPSLPSKSQTRPSYPEPFVGSNHGIEGAVPYSSSQDSEQAYQTFEDERSYTVDRGQFSVRRDCRSERLIRSWQYFREESADFSSAKALAVSLGQSASKQKTARSYDYVGVTDRRLIVEVKRNVLESMPEDSAAAGSNAFIQIAKVLYSIIASVFFRNRSYTLNNHSTKLQYVEDVTIKTVRKETRVTAVAKVVVYLLLVNLVFFCAALGTGNMVATGIAIFSQIFVWAALILVIPLFLIVAYLRAREVRIRNDEAIRTQFFQAPNQPKLPERLTADALDAFGKEGSSLAYDDPSQVSRDRLLRSTTQTVILGFITMALVVTALTTQKYASDHLELLNTPTGELSSSMGKKKQGAQAAAAFGVMGALGVLVVGTLLVRDLELCGEVITVLLIGYEHGPAPTAKRIHVNIHRRDAEEIRTLIYMLRDDEIKSYSAKDPYERRSVQPEAQK